MPSSVIFVLGIEMAFIFLTTLFLIQPRMIFKKVPLPIQLLFKWCGMFFLGLTFCWSIVVGVVLSMNNLSLHI